MRALALLLTFLPLTACNLYFNDEHTHECEDYASGDRAPSTDPLLRNPATGQCEARGRDEVPEYYCGDSATDSTVGEPLPPPTWGSCESYCTGLGEDACLQAEGCRGIYQAYDSGTDTPDIFRECWQADTGDRTIVTSCEEQDAYGCSLSDECVAVHQFDCPDTSPVDGGLEAPCTPSFFLSCFSEEPQVRPGECKDMLDEVICLEHSYCTPYYIGVDCNCTPEGCDCNEWVFDSCDAGV